MVAMSDKQPSLVLGERGMLRDKPGFSIELITSQSLNEQTQKSDRHQILMVMHGHWCLRWSQGETVLASGDTCAIPPGVEYHLTPSMTGHASVFRVTNTDDPAGSTQWL